MRYFHRKRCTTAKHPVGRLHLSCPQPFSTLVGPIWYARAPDGSPIAFGVANWRPNWQLQCRNGPRISLWLLDIRGQEIDAFVLGDYPCKERSAPTQAIGALPFGELPLNSGPCARPIGSLPPARSRLCRKECLRALRVHTWPGSARLRMPSATYAAFAVSVACRRTNVLYHEAGTVSRHVKLV